MTSNPTTNRRKRSALVVACVLLSTLLLAGCPGKNNGAKPGRAQTSQINEGEYPEAALTYLEDCLKHPTEGYPALAYSWTVVAQLDKLPEAPGGAAIRAEIGKQFDDSGKHPPSELVAAWLNCAPDKALDYIKEQAAQGDWRYVNSLWFHPDLARRTLADPATAIVPKSGVSVDLATNWLEMQHYWGYVSPSDKAFLNNISNLQNDPKDTLRAAGWLLRLDPSDKRFSDYLELGIKSASFGKYSELMGAAEGIKISRNPKLAEILVPIAASVILKDTVIPKGHEALKKLTQANAQQIYTAYALTYLPGEQASVLRRKLLTAKDSTVRWQSRLGELLHGNPKPWEDAIAATGGLDDKDMWVVVEAVDAPEPALLPTLKLMAGSKDVSMRMRALTQLNRFRQFASNPDVVELLAKLTKDEIPEVRTAAWYASGKVGVGDPLAVLSDAKETSDVRLAAAYAALMVAQDGPPEMRGVKLDSISGDSTGKPDKATDATESNAVTPAQENNKAAGGSTAPSSNPKAGGK